MFSQKIWEEIKQAYISKHTSEIENKVNLIMIREGEKWHYLDYNKELRQEKKDNYYCINCLNSFRTEKKPKSHENVSKIHDYCHVKIPEKFDNTSKYHQRKSIKLPFSNYVDTESLLSWDMFMGYKSRKIINNRNKGWLKLKTFKHLKLL